MPKEAAGAHDVCSVLDGHHDVCSVGCVRMPMSHVRINTHDNKLRDLPTQIQVCHPKATGDPREPVQQKRRPSSQVGFRMGWDMVGYRAYGTWWDTVHGVGHGGASGMVGHHAWCGTWWDIMHGGIPCMVWDMVGIMHGVGHGGTSCMVWDMVGHHAWCGKWWGIMHCGIPCMVGYRAWCGTWWCVTVPTCVQIRIKICVASTPQAHPP